MVEHRYISKGRKLQVVPTASTSEVILLGDGKKLSAEQVAKGQDHLGYSRESFVRGCVLHFDVHYQLLTLVALCCNDSQELLSLNTHTRKCIILHSSSFSPVYCTSTGVLCKDARQECVIGLEHHNVLANFGEDTHLKLGKP